MSDLRRRRASVRLYSGPRAQPRGHRRSCPHDDDGVQFYAMGQGELQGCGEGALEGYSTTLTRLTISLNGQRSWLSLS
jgi:hypothetical protein